MSRPLALAALAVGLLAVFAAASARTMREVAGVYNLVGVREAASQFVLHADGRFEFGLSYGALDKSGKGRWRLDGDAVVLTSDGPHNPPRFTLERSGAGQGGGATVLVTVNGRGVALIDVVLELSNGQRLTGYTQTYGYRTALPAGVDIRAILLGVRMYDLAPQRIEIAERGRRDFTVRFDPGDISQQRFENERLPIIDGALVWQLGGQPLRYRKR